MKRLVFSIIPVLVLCVIFSMTISPEFNRRVLSTMENTGQVKDFFNNIFNSYISSWWNKEPFINFRSLIVILIGAALLLIYYIIFNIIDIIITAITGANRKKTTSSLALSPSLPSKTYVNDEGIRSCDRYAAIYNNRRTAKLLSSFQVNAVDDYYEKLSPLKYRDLISGPGTVSLNRVETIRNRDGNTNDEDTNQLYRLIDIFEKNDEEKEEVNVNPIASEQIDEIEVDDVGNTIEDSYTNVWKNLFPVISDDSVEAELNAYLAPLTQVKAEVDFSPLTQMLVIDDELFAQEYADYIKAITIVPEEPVVEEEPIAIIEEELIASESELIIPEGYVEERIMVNDSEKILYRHKDTGEYIAPVVYNDEVIWIDQYRQVLFTTPIKRSETPAEEPAIIVEESVVEVVPEPIEAAPEPVVEPVVEKAPEPVIVAATTTTPNARRRRGVGSEEAFFDDISTNVEKKVREEEFPFVQGVRPRKKLTVEDLFAMPTKKVRRKTAFAYTENQEK